jgi:hypothetical protein
MRPTNHFAKKTSLTVAETEFVFHQEILFYNHVKFNKILL